MRSRKTLAATLALIGVFFTVSVFGGEITSFVEKVPSMLVINDDKHPVPVRDLSAPGRHAVVFFDNEPMPNNAFNGRTDFLVPDGKRLVIESVSFEMNLPPGQALVRAQIQTRVNGGFTAHHLPATFNGPLGGRSFYVASAQRTLYADGGTVVVFDAFRSDSDGSADVSISMSGHLIDCEVAACE